ncbi:PDZ domain-containing protein [Candidatus Amesbacteria bacterium]|nr:PDZ domain-containing protein [Candidatus Amesbacteria bacterium]
MKLRNLILVVCLVAVSATMGYEFGQQKLKWSFKNWRPAVVVNKLPTLEGKPADVDFALFWTVWDKMNAEYVDKTALDAVKMVNGAISGMVAAAGDPYTVFLSPQENKEAKEDLGGSFEGVGIQLGFRDGRLAVVSPLAGMPAIKAGVRAGDYILHIKDTAKNVDRDTEGMSLPEAVKLIRGPKGTKVELSLLHNNNGEEPYSITLWRETIVVKSVQLEFINNVAWVKLTRFGDLTQGEWEETVSRIKNQELSSHARGIRGIVLDLRNNPGGYLEGAVYIAGEFLPAGKSVVAQQYGDGTKINDTVKRNGRLLKTPLVVVVNKGSASAAEILAGALQDYKRAKIVGEQSFGKGSVQQPEDFSGGAGLHVTIARWLRPNGEWLDKKGITPDVIVKYEPDGNASDSGDWKSDLQLVKAVEML